MTRKQSARWNHNVHYHQVVLNEASSGARSALDVGTGNGLLAAELAEVVESVAAIDLDARVLDEARHESARVQWICGDVMTHPFDREAFDVVASVATLHHLGEPERALRRCAELTAPGGVLVVVAMARASRINEHVVQLAGAVQHRVMVKRHGWWEHTAPTLWPPPNTFRQVRAAADRTLPGYRWRLLPMWRYSIIWPKPPRDLSHQMHD